MGRTVCTMSEVMGGVFTSDSNKWPTPVQERRVYADKHGICSCESDVTVLWQLVSNIVPATKVPDCISYHNNAERPPNARILNTGILVSVSRVP